MTTTHLQINKPLKLTIIMLLVLILKITTFAKSQSQTQNQSQSQQPSKCTPLSQNSQLILKTIEYDLNSTCLITQKYFSENQTLSDLTIHCPQKNRKMTISINNNKIYFIDKITPQKNNLIQCWVEGELQTDNCQLNITAKKCQKWNLSIQ